MPTAVHPSSAKSINKTDRDRIVVTQLAGWVECKCDMIDERTTNVRLSCMLARCEKEICFGRRLWIDNSALLRYRNRYFVVNNREQSRYKNYIYSKFAQEQFILYCAKASILSDPAGLTDFHPAIYYCMLQVIRHP